MRDRLKRLAVFAAWSAHSRAWPSSTSERRLVLDRPALDASSQVREVTGPVYLEPRWGYLIGPRGQLLADAIRPNMEYKSSWRMGLPSPVEYGLARLKKGRVQEYPEVISVRHWWEWNYYHFMLDVLGKLQLLDQAGLPHDIPLVVGRYALDLPWVQQILSIGTLADRPWIIQEDEFIRAEKVYYCQTREPYRVRIDHVLRNMDLPPADPGARKRIFLNRKGSTRRLMNEAEVRAILESHGFEEVFAEDYSVQEQIDLFSGVRYLVALHGAGLTNIIYRRGVPLSLLELYPDDWQSWDFAAICSSYGYGWRGIGGPSQSSRDPVHADFLIAPDQLERELARMLSVTDSLLQPV